MASSFAEPAPPGQERTYPQPTKSGKVAFRCASSGVECETAYYIYGDLSSGRTPLVGVHGGPGAGHSYLRPLSLLWVDYKIPVVLYDQVGCGASTHFKGTKGDTELWKPELFMNEFENLMSKLEITQYDWLGQSWGGMLGGQFAIERQPKCMRKLIISNSPSDMKVWVQAAQKLRAKLPQDVQETLTRCEKERKTDTEEYQQAVMAYYDRHVCRTIPRPAEYTETLECLENAMEVYETMNGPSEFFVTGSFKDWSITNLLHKVTKETCPGGLLVLNGYYDEAQDETCEPFFTKPTCRTKWKSYALSSHLTTLEETERYVKDVGAFLLSD
ncbi:hypothetical protein BAUCODRAFT_63944 [Baudoinia panamericana UAMH 10762]|uniref:AB hydrolase-1 domain-containing protein n=1 Tax=Baudoinia panamericana (strain UAMH 10762) TaxID=717646 RepID=M2N6U2_BAUPA|nr:uncharacterized protein BAUCODRAFT_63944 [Baudoinia panamericana UAMH 10762]EMC99818.1 hypothetical protein BAUCODRAFT_63944 [Baudoinia panamericana UAMH 10762]